MSQDSLQTELLLKWEEAYEQGEDLSAESLCRECPELVEDIERAIEKLKRQREQMALHEAELSSTAPDNTPVLGEASSSAPQTPPKIVGRYVLEEELGRGGIGVVYRAKDSQLNRSLAIKVLRDEHHHNDRIKQRFLEEAQIMGQLQHPGVAPIHEVGETEAGLVYFAMKQIHGQTLATLLNDRSDLEQQPTKWLSIFSQVCQTVAYAHSRGILHRDLKPANIMVGPFGEVQVMDWGLAKVLPKGTSSKDTISEVVPHIQTIRTEYPKEHDTQAGSVLGTLAYMPPEQARGEIDRLDERCDVFALGAILCQILTGVPPYAGRNILELHTKAGAGDLAAAFEQLDDCSADGELVQLCKACLAAQIDERPDNAGVVSEQVTVYMESVQARLRRAEIEAAEAIVKAEAEQKQRELAQAKVVEEKKRRRATLIMAIVAFLLLGSIGVGGFAAWKQWNLERTRYAEGITQIYVLLKTSRFEDAQLRHGQLTDGLSMWVPGRSRKALEQTKEEIELLKAFAEIRQRRTGITDGRFDNKIRAAEDYRDLFQRKGFLRTDIDFSMALERWVQDRNPVVREHVVAALDDWGDCLHALQKDRRDLLRTVLATSQKIDSNSERNELREFSVWADLRKSAKRIQSLDLRKHSPQLLFILSLRLPAEKRTFTRIQFLNQALTHYPNDFWLLFALGNAYLQQDEFDAAIGCYRSALVVRSKVAVTLNNWGLALAGKKDFEAAIEKYQQATSINPEYAQAYTNWGVALRHKKDFNGAIEKYKKAIKFDPRDAKAHANWSVALRFQGDLVGAIQQCKHAIGIDRKLPGAYINWAAALDDQKDYDGAIEKLQQAIHIDSTYASAYYNLGLLLSEKGKYKEAIENYKRAESLGFRLPRMYYDWGVALGAQKQLDRAIEKYIRATVIDSKYAKAYFGWGVALDLKKDFDGALEKYKQATILDSTFAQAYHNWGLILARKNKIDDAIQKYHQAVIHKPNYPDAYNSWGIALGRKGDAEAAIKKYQQAIAWNNKFAPAYHNWGLQLARKKDFNGAIEKYRQATTYNPQFARAYRYWGTALVGKKDFDGAIEKFERAATLDSKDAVAFYNWALILDLKKKPNEAIKKYNLALKINSDYAEAHCGLGLVLRDQGQFSLAVKHFRRGHSLGTKRGPRWAFPSAEWLKNGEQLLRLEQQRPAIIRGRVTVSVAEQLTLIDACKQYTKRYRDATRLYDRLFHEHPKLAEDQGSQDRYHAATCAVLAAHGKGADAKPIGPKERSQFRKLALRWLQEDLKAYRGDIKRNRFLSPATAHRMQHWQHDPHLASVREANTRPGLPKEEQQSWDQLWKDVKELHNTARSQYTETKLVGMLTARTKKQFHKFKMVANRTYVIQMESKQFVPSLGLQTAKGDALTQKARNSRIHITPTKTAVHVIVASAFRHRGHGDYQIVVWEFKSPKQKDSDPPEK